MCFGIGDGNIVTRLWRIVGVHVTIIRCTCMPCPTPTSPETTMTKPEERVMQRTPSGKTNCPQAVLDKIYGAVTKQDKAKELEEDMRAFERSNSRVADRVHSASAPS